jgi:hypothetical protein
MNELDKKEHPHNKDTKRGAPIGAGVSRNRFTPGRTITRDSEMCYPKRPGTEAFPRCGHVEACAPSKQCCTDKCFLTLNQKPNKTKTYNPNIIHHNVFGGTGSIVRPYTLRTTSKTQSINWYTPCNVLFTRLLSAPVDPKTKLYATLCLLADHIQDPVNQFSYHTTPSVASDRLSGFGPHRTLQGSIGALSGPTGSDRPASKYYILYIVRNTQ